MRPSVAIVIAIVAIAIIIAAFFVFRKPAPLRVGELTGLPAQFVKILPDDLPLEQKMEIEGLLRRFQTKAMANQFPAEEYNEVMGLLTKYLDQGSIGRDDLNFVMAKVGYYSYHGFSPDSSDIHPLLDPTPFPGDTARTQP